MGVEEDQTGCNVGSVGIANGYQSLRAETVSVRSRHDELRQLISPELEILDVKHAFGDPAKETGHAILRDFASHPEECSARPEFISKRQKIVVVRQNSVRVHFQQL
jgi:hypothetical protein